MTQKKELLKPGDRVRVVELRQEAEPFESEPKDIVGLEGTVEWVTPGFAGDKTIFEVKLDDGRIVHLYAKEIEPVEA